MLALPPGLRRQCPSFEGLQHGTIDRSLFTDNANSYFNEQALKDLRAWTYELPNGKLEQYQIAEQNNTP
jgi:hypothetical protein